MTSNPDNGNAENGPDRASDQSQNQESNWDRPLDTQNVHYIVGRIDAKVGDLEKNVGKIETDLRTLLWGGIAAVVILLGAGWDTRNRLADNIVVASTDAKAQVAELGTTVDDLDDKIQEIKERLIRLETSNTETLSRIEQTLGSLTLKIDGQSSIEGVGDGLQKRPAVQPSGALPVDENNFAEVLDPSSDYLQTVGELSEGGWSTFMTENSSFTSCTRTDLGDTRVVAVVYESAQKAVPCKVLYIKNDFINEIASVKNTEGFCEKKERAIVRNLVEADWQCVHNFTGEIARNEDNENPIAKYRQDLYALEGGDLSKALTDVDAFVLTAEAAEKAVKAVKGVSGIKAMGIK